MTIGRVDERSEIHRRRWWTTLRLSTDHPLRIGCFWTVPYSQEIRRSNLSDNRSRPPLIAPARGPPSWEDAPEPVPDGDCFGQPEPDCAFDQSDAW